MSYSLWPILLTGLMVSVIAPSSASAEGGPSGGPHPEKQTIPAGKAGNDGVLLDSLLDRLAKADDADSAKILSEAVWKVWLRSGSPTIDLLMQQAVDAMNGSKNDVALKLLDAIVDLAPDYAEGWNKRATVYYLQDEHHKSALDIRKVLEIEPRHYGALAGLGMIMRDLGDGRGALAAFREALKYHPFLKGALDAVGSLSVTVEGRGI